jgi:hypothetical protein
VNNPADSMTVIIVNRDMTTARKVTVNLNEFSVNNGTYKTLQLSTLPATETFKSHTNNALKANSVTVNSNSFSITVPALSTTAVILNSGTTGISELKNPAEIKIFPNPANNQLKITINRAQGNYAPFCDGKYFILLNSYGQTVAVENLQPGIDDYTINTSDLSAGLYLIKFGNEVQRLIIQHP